MTTVRKNKKGWLFLTVAVAIFLIITLGNSKGRKYDKAADYMWDGNYEAAIEIYEELDSYENSQTLLMECQYQLADRMLRYREYREALNMFESLGEYSDSRQKVLECQYFLGEEAMDEEAYLEAYGYFILAQTYDGAAQMADKALYEHGHQLFVQGDPNQAQKYFDMISVMPEDAYPHFVTLEDARDYLEAQSSILSEEINCYVLQMPQGNPGDSDWDLLCNYVPMQSGNVFYYPQSLQLQIKARYYPGVRIVYAWRTGDTSILTQAELEAMQKAQELVDKARAKNDASTAVELYLYNWLCNHVSYESPDMNVDTDTYMSLRQLNCLGALLDGKANCQGYTDAFYLLATMAGFDVCRISGFGEGGGHCWNGITLNGKCYIVDVTFGDADELGSTAKTYTWYNSPLDPQVYTVSGGTDSVPELVMENDLSQTYYKQKKSVFTKVSDAAYYLLRQYKKNGKGWTFAVVEDEEITKKQLESAVKNNRKKAGVGSYSYTYVLRYYAGNTYLALKWK